MNIQNKFRCGVSALMISAAPLASHAQTVEKELVARTDTVYQVADKWIYKSNIIQPESKSTVTATFSKKPTYLIRMFKGSSKKDPAVAVQQFGKTSSLYQENGRWVYETKILSPNGSQSTIKAYYSKKPKLKDLK